MSSRGSPSGAAVHTSAPSSPIATLPLHCAKLVLASSISLNGRRSISARSAPTITAFTIR
jgi:hypothetical protein